MMRAAAQKARSSCCTCLWSTYVNTILSIDGEEPPPLAHLTHLSSPEERRERFEEHQAFQDEVRRREFAEKGFYEVEARYFTELAEFQALIKEKLAKIGYRGVNVSIFGGFM